MTAAHRLAVWADLTVGSPGEVVVDRIRLHQLPACSLSVEADAPELVDVLPEGVRHVPGVATAVTTGARVVVVQHAEDDAVHVLALIRRAALLDAGLSEPYGTSMRLLLLLYVAGSPVPSTPARRTQVAC